jgi:carbonic anhydrase/acetyltransferase-like protein (isoleucine patch superfamily)
VPLFSFEGLAPTVHPTAFVAPTATLVGDVRVEEGASIWYNAVLRADFGPIVVRAGANVQDGCVLHGGDDPVTEIGVGATIGHLCVVHGSVIGAECVIGNGATIQDGARIGARSLIGAGSTVPPNKVIPEGTLVLGPAAATRGGLTPEAERWVRTNPEIYRELAQRHAKTVTPVVP